jgi:hypothetical protein
MVFSRQTARAVLQAVIATWRTALVVIYLTSIAEQALLGT